MVPSLVTKRDLIAFTKLHKGKFFIGVMRTDGTGERLLTENFYQEALHGLLMVELSYFIEKLKLTKRERVFRQNYGL